MVGITDQLSPFGDAVVLARALLGSVAALALSRFVFRVFNVPPPWAIVPVLAALFVGSDAFLIYLARRAAHPPSQVTPLARRQGLARVLGDLAGVAAGWIIFFR